MSLNRSVQKKPNSKVRKAKRSSGITASQIADLMGIAEATWFYRMRHEMPEAEQNRIVALIEKWERSNPNY